MPVASKTRLGTRSQPEQSRADILQAAVREFAREGVAGARTDAIARSAGVNKALLYYYFKDKEGLYQAVLDEVFSGVRVVIQNALAQDLPPRERLRAYVLAHLTTSLPSLSFRVLYRPNFYVPTGVRRKFSGSPNDTFVRFLKISRRSSRRESGPENSDLSR